jgi:hypothetical protein
MSDVFSSDVTEALRRRLSLTARDFARSALDRWGAEDYAGFYLYAGTALELALKARLARHNVALLAPSDGQWFSHLMRLSQPDTIGNEAPKTLTGMQALERIQKLSLTKDVTLGEAVTSTIARCNRVKHLGMGEPPPEQERNEEAAAFVRALHALLTGTPDELWQEHRAGLAKSLVETARNEALVRVGQKRLRAQEKLDALSAAEVAMLGRNQADQIHWLELNERSDRIQFAVMSCPICGSPARAYGPLVADFEPDYDRDGEIDGWNWYADTVVERLKCAVCGFELVGDEELEVANIETRIHNEIAVEEDVFDVADGHF